MLLSKEYSGLVKRWILVVGVVCVVGFVMAGAGCDGGSVQGKSGRSNGTSAKTGGGEVVVYCAHDSVFSEAILEDFENETGIDVKVKFDTEATKSLGLTELLIAEKDNPKCDVFWNNQLLGTADLASKGVLESYKGEGWKRMPEGLKDKDGLYTGFAGRLRVIIYNTDAKLDLEVFEAGDLDGIVERGMLSRGAIAKPLYGTTLSHYAVMSDLFYLEGMTKWHDDWRAGGIVEKGGNSTVKNLVASGVCDWGYTDTDDFYVGKDDGKPVAMLPAWVRFNSRGSAFKDRLNKNYMTEHDWLLQDTGVELANGEGRKWTICIPNTVGLIKGAKNDANAKRLIDYLLSEEVELKLAASKARQIPLGNVDETKLSAEVRQLKQWAKDAYPIADLLKQRNETLRWLKGKYLK